MAESPESSEPNWGRYNNLMDSKTSLNEHKNSLDMYMDQQSREAAYMGTSHGSSMPRWQRNLEETQ